MNNSLWKLDTGWLCGYTQDRDLIRRVKRYKKDWSIMADYYKGRRLVGVQFKIPMEQRRPAERMFGITYSDENEAV
ncbi:hypothetical protein Q0N12_16395 [Rossellomorea marisflavi]|uniref:hypothetical protein n=1 Tax=Rossellomorea marisflavi TaxID=189381 RepID=UPI00345A027A